MKEDTPEETSNELGYPFKTNEDPSILFEKNWTSWRRNLWQSIQSTKW
jgi:hypothetical protein